jgi:hypothetical protein
MKLYKIYQDINTDYDSFESAVVVANSAEEAQNIHPSGGEDRFDAKTPNDWVSRPDLVEVIYLGEVGRIPLGPAFYPAQDMYSGAIICRSRRK